MDWSKLTPNDKLIMDIGVSEGNDTAYYLAKGFDVIAVEADPNSCEKRKKKIFAICRGRDATSLEFPACQRFGAYVKNIRQ